MLSTKLPRNNKSAPAGPGRPRGFAPDQALLKAMDVFWQNGYEATSLDDLTGAMGLSRSSFYACFGSKHAVLMAAVTSYADGFYAAIGEIAATEPDALRAVQKVLARIVDVRGGTHGCFFVNSVTERMPHDAELAAYGQNHLAPLSALISQLLRRCGFPAKLAKDRASALLALAMGAVMLRKAGSVRHG